MTKKQKKILITSIVSPIIAVSTISCVSLAIANTLHQNSLYNFNNSNNNKDNNIYTFDNNSFDNKYELLNYANSLLETKTQQTSIPFKYTIKNDYKESELNSLDELYDFVKERVQVFSKISSRDIKTAPNGEISASDEINFLSDLTDPKVDVYRGKDNSIHTSKEEAKDTYFNIFEPYYFKDTYFRSKEELKLWLEQNSDQWFFNKVPNSIVLTAPNGVVSMPIQIENIKSDEKSTKQYIKDFVKANSLNNIELINYLDDSKDVEYFDEDSLNDFKDKYSPDYIYVNSNHGKGSYIIDSSIEDEGELNGPYFVSTSSLIDNVSNTKLWRATTNNDRLEVSQYDDIKILSSFFDSVLQMSAENEHLYNVFFSVSNVELQQRINDYYTNLSHKYPSIYNSLREIFETISNGKRYSSFYKIPIIFYHTMDQIIYWKAPHSLVEESKKLFIDICDYYDSCIYSLVPDELLYGTDPKKTLFSFKNFFGIDKKNIDLNVDFGYFLTKALENYKELFKVSKVIPIFVSIKNQLGSTYTMPFKLDFFNQVYGLDIEKSKEYWYSLIWYTVSTDNFNEMQLCRWFFDSKLDFNSKINIMDACKPISQYYYSNFVGQWQRTLVFNEAIRYSLTHSKWIYTDEQVDFFKSLGFMRYEKNCDVEYLVKHYMNLEYMRDLYEINDKKIENIFYIIMSMFDKDSNKTLYELFGEPKKYNDEEYSSKIYDLFYDYILSDTKKFVEYSNNVFNLDSNEISIFSNVFDMEIDFDNKSIIEGNIDEVNKTKIENNKILTVKSYPSKLRYEREGDKLKEIIDNPKIETEIIEVVGRPILGLFWKTDKNLDNKQIVRHLDDIEIPFIGYWALDLPEPFKSGTIDILLLDGIKKWESIDKAALQINDYLYKVTSNGKTILGTRPLNFGQGNIPDIPNTSNRPLSIKDFSKSIAESARQISLVQDGTSEAITLAKIRQSYNHDLRAVATATTRTYIDLRKNVISEFRNKYPNLIKNLKNIGVAQDELFDFANYYITKYKDDVEKLTLSRDNKIITAKLNAETEYSNMTGQLTNSMKNEINQLNQLEVTIRDTELYANELYANAEKCRLEALKYPEGSEMRKHYEKEYSFQRQHAERTSLQAEEFRTKYNDSKRNATNRFQRQENRIREHVIQKHNTAIQVANTDFDNGRNKVFKQTQTDLKKSNADFRKNLDNKRNFKKNSKAIASKVGMAIGSIVGIAFSAFMIFDIIMNFHKIDYISYAYETSDFRLVWDGGYRESYFFGLINGSSKGIDSMKLLKPVKLVNPNIEHGYYYNGFTYETEKELENIQYKDILNGLYKPSSINNVYSFEKIVNNKPKNPDYVNSDINKLGDNVYNAIKNEVNLGIIGNSSLSFVRTYNYKLDIDSIYSINVDNGKYGSLNQAINALVNQIKPLKIAYIPILQENTKFPISRDDSEKDNSIPNFVLPYKTWNSTQGGIKENTNVNNFVFVNQNEGEYKGLSDTEAKEKLLSLFREKFDVPMKTTTKKESLNYKFANFSDLSSKATEIKLYKANGAYGDTKNFLNGTDAFNYIWNSYGINIEVSIKKFEIFIFENKIFYSKQEYINWVLKNTEVLNSD